MNKHMWYVFAVLLVLTVLFSTTLALATPVSVTVKFANAPENLNGQTAYFYGSSGLVTSTSISNNATSASLEPGIYVMKVTGSKTQTLLLINTNETTSYTLDYARSPIPMIMLNVTVKGVMIPVDYTVKIETSQPTMSSYTIKAAALNQTMGSKYLGYIFGINVNSATVSFPSQLLFPTIFGYQLKSITLDGKNVTNGFSVSVGQHDIVVEYEQAGLPLWVIAVAVLAIIIIAVIAGRKGGRTVTFATMLNQGEWWERVDNNE